MKVVFLVAAAFTAVVGGSVVYKHSTASATSTGALTSETISIQNHSLSGNISEELKGVAEADLTTTNKSVLKFKVNSKRVVYFNSEVDSNSVRAATNALKKLEAQSNEPIWLMIDSPGGSVLDGATLISQMEASKAPVYTVCTRLCASMAAMFHSYGAKRYSLDRALLMYHPASAGAQGQVNNMISLLKTFSRFINKMNSNVVKRSKISKAEFDSLVAYELWIDSEDALQKGLIDGIVNLDVPNSPEGEQTGEMDNGSNPTKPKRGAVNFDLIAPFNING